MIIDLSLPFHKHCTYVSDRIDKINNLLNALVGSSWGQEKETLLLTYNALGNLSQAMQHQSGAPTQVAQALRRYRKRRMRLGGRPEMASIYHIHQKSLTLKVNDHSGMLSAQYLVNCLEETISVMASQLKTKTHEGDSTPNITQLFFLDSAQAGRKTTTICTHTR